MRIFILSMLLILCLGSNAVAGTMYRCKKPDGSMSFSDMPCKSNESNLTPKRAPQKSPAVTPAQPRNAEEIAVYEMKQRSLVKDAGVLVEGDYVNLVIEMNDAVNEKYAKSMGDDFMRLYITFSPDEPNKPGKEIGPTQYNYKIGIYNSQRKFIFMGAKVDVADRITW